MISHNKLENNYEYLEIKNRQAEAKIALQGAHVFHYKANNKSDLLWLSKTALFKEAKAIRGGIPICFPWFGPHQTDNSLPQHGFARTSLWKPVVEDELDADRTHVQLQLTSTKESLKLWPYDFDIRLDIVVGSELTLTLTVINTDTKPFEISTALHTYFKVSNIDNVSVEGLDENEYIDSLTNESHFQKGVVKIEKEVDRVYYNITKPIILHDKFQSLTINQRGSNSLVVWNPWIEKSKGMSDMLDDGYKNMLCLETGNVGKDARVLQAGERHALTLTI